MLPTAPAGCGDVGPLARRRRPEPGDTHPVPADRQGDRPGQGRTGPHGGLPQPDPDTPAYPVCRLHPREVTGGWQSGDALQERLPASLASTTATLQPPPSVLPPWPCAWQTEALKWHAQSRVNTPPWNIPLSFIDKAHILYKKYM